MLFVRLKNEVFNVRHVRNVHRGMIPSAKGETPAIFVVFGDREELVVLYSSEAHRELDFAKLVDWLLAVPE